MKVLLTLILFSLSFFAKGSSCPANRPDLFCLTEEMDLNKEIGVSNFFILPVKIINLFSPEVKELNQTIILDARWESPYFGAGVTVNKAGYSLMILAGTTRVKNFTLDAYAALICHEIGHILGGSPRKTISFSEWASSEGQSDFFAASVCLPRYFKSLKLNEEEIAARVEKAGYEMLYAFKQMNSGVDDGSGREIVRYYEHSYQVPSTLVNQYPSLQCRYENFRNPKKRPSCWFKD